MPVPAAADPGVFAAGVLNTPAAVARPAVPGGCSPAAADVLLPANRDLLAVTAAGVCNTAPAAAPCCMLLLPGVNCPGSLGGGAGISPAAAASCCCIRSCCNCSLRCRSAVARTSAATGVPGMTPAGGGDLRAAAGASLAAAGSCPGAAGCCSCCCCWVFNSSACLMSYRISLANYIPSQTMLQLSAGQHVAMNDTSGACWPSRICVFC